MQRKLRRLQKRRCSDQQCGKCQKTIRRALKIRCARKEGRVVETAEQLIQTESGPDQARIAQTTDNKLLARPQNGSAAVTVEE